VNTRTIRFCVLVGVILFAETALGEGPYYARGSHYAGKGEIWGVDSGNQLFDDGDHGDGIAGDGIYGAYVVSDQPPGGHEWKIANADWTENYPNNPNYPMENAYLYTFDDAETIHFRLDTNFVGDSWQPAANAVACSHFSPPETAFEVIGSPVELGEWQFGIPATLVDGIWTVDVTITETGLHEYKFRVVGTWSVCNVGIHYNMLMGENFDFVQDESVRTYRMQFNTIDGRGRALDMGPVDIRTVAWSALKALYRSP